MGKETFGSPISEELVKQIAVRENLYSSNNKNSFELFNIHSNTGWVKLRSSVNTLTVTEADQLATSKVGRSSIIGDSSAAQSLVLIAGASNSSEEGGIAARSGIDITGDLNTMSAYRNYVNGLGIRPMPGITSLKVDSKGTYGALMQAEVGFTVWTVEDLEKCETLYFRPGYTALLEFGHSCYTDNSGNLRRTGPDGSTVNNGFFSPLTIDTLEGIVRSLRDYHNGNYEALFGYIVNFSWSFRKDGGYDCTVKLISKGVVLDGLKVGPAQNSVTVEEMSNEDTETGMKERKSIYHYIFNKLSGYKSGPTAKMSEALSAKNDKTVSGKLKVKGDFDIFRTNMDISDSSTFIFEETINLIYIPLRGFLQIFNMFGSPKDPNRPDINTNLVVFNTEIHHKFLTFPEHYSVNPLVAIPPKQSTRVEYNVIKDGLHALIEKSANTGGLDDILNIMVSTHFLEKTLDQYMDGAKEEGIGFLDVLKSVLAGVQNALGEVNDFDISYDDSTNTHTIIDRKTFLEVVEIPVITVSGIGTTVSELTITSKISSEIASQISIAAQGSSGDYQDNVATILEWNRAVVDRHNLIKDVEEKPDTEAAAAEVKKKEKFEEDMTDVWESFNGTGGLFSGQKFDTELFDQLRGSAIIDLSKILKSYVEKEGKNVPGAIPVELSIKMVGLGGFKIGSAFKVSKGVLPAKYDNFCYLITGIDHEISDNKWYTSLKTQFYPIRKPSANVQQAARGADRGTPSKTDPGYKPPANKYTSQSCVDDSKIKLSPNFNLAQLSCAGIVVKASLPAPGQLKSHPTYGNLAREDIISNLKNLAMNVLEPIKKVYPTMFVTNAYRNNGGKSQHEAGMAADIQFSDLTGSLSTQNALILERAKRIKALLGKNYDQLLLEYKTTRGGRPWIHVTYRSTGHRNEASTFLNDTYAAKGRGNLYNAL